MALQIASACAAAARTTVSSKNSVCATTARTTVSSKNSAMSDRRMIRESVDREDEEFRFSFCCDMHAAKAAKMVMKCVYAIQITHFCGFIFYLPCVLPLSFILILVTRRECAEKALIPMFTGVYSGHRSYFVCLVVWEIEVILQDIYFTLLISANNEVIKRDYARLTDFIENKEVYVICFALACVFEFLLFILFYNVMNTYNNFLKDQEKARIESMKLKEVLVRKESGAPAGDSKKVETTTAKTSLAKN
ncbi:hypothetical protein PRIPAC_87615 [Pristionchus pacificus]|uniref:Uncharacterized protein n=1 Tax=Pristionchus pacificus TaxID=54126 RepID=A0A2A6B6F8_PRIPA|nr:hypothetical protein PRIPAC_87615 [Pristionchus pacificus]|eukprot:PDM61433.1 hypothetical protein PRIPAC_50875 [Pristionchus pacificus]